MHSLLSRQLRKLGLDSQHSPDAVSWAKLLPTIEQTYLDADLERYTLERSLAISSEEMQALYQRQKSSYEARLHTLFVTIQDPIWLKDPEGAYLACNPMFARLFGVGEADIIGKSDYDFFDKTLADSRRAKDMKVIEARMSCINEEWVTFADDGHRALLETVQTPMWDENGKLVGVLGIARDITKRKQAEEKLKASEERMRIFFDNVPLGIFSSTRAGKFTYVNPALPHILGYDSSEEIMEVVNRTSVAEALYVEAPRRQEIMQELDRDDKHWQTFENRYRRKDGQIVDAIVSIGERHDPITGETIFDGIVTDITERKLAEANLAESERRYRLLIEMANEGIGVAQDGLLKFVNPMLKQMVGYSEDELVGHSFFEWIHPEDKERVEINYLKRLQGEAAEQSYQLRILTKHDGIKWVEMSGVIIDWEGRPATLNFLSDITDRKQHEQQLEHIAHYDALTNLPNRVLLADRLHQGMTHTQRRDQRLAVAYLDLDGFKSINDSHGHDVGDQLLMIVGQRMKLALREGDTLARIGGDEFVAVLQDLTDIESSIPMLNRLLAAAAQPVEVSDLVLQISASLGATFYPQTEEVDADQLLRQADQAMYQAKLMGKGRYHVFDTEQDSSIRSHHESLEAIRRALIGREFVLYYQPKVNMRTGAVVGAEALIRWQHPEKGLLPPGVFLPVIEDHPLAVEIGEWVIDTALTQLELWHQAGLDIPVSVNVGALQLQQAGFVTNLRDILAAHPNVTPGCLEIEVLETSALEDIARVSQVMAACCEIGVSFALDDFGTGYSSLTYLKRLPISMLKIDQSFVRDMLYDPDDLAILEGVLGLAIAFRREVIAEGVETLESGAMLLQLGCDHAQGYAIARPMLAHDMPVWAASWRPDITWENRPPVSRDDLPVLFASVEHRAWITAIDAFLKGKRETPPPIDPHQCRFGQWLDTDGLARHKTRPAFKAIDTLHHQVHTLAAKLLALHAQGEKTEALTRLGELHGLRDELSEQLKVLVREERQ